MTCFYTYSQVWFCSLVFSLRFGNHKVWKTRTDCLWHVRFSCVLRSCDVKAEEERWLRAAQVGGNCVGAGAQVPALTAARRHRPGLWRKRSLLTHSLFVFYLSCVCGGGGDTVHGMCVMMYYANVRQWWWMLRKRCEYVTRACSSHFRHSMTSWVLHLDALHQSWDVAWQFALLCA